MLIGRILLKVRYECSKIIEPFRIVYNWYIPNLIPLLAEQVLLEKGTPECIQKTKITGSGKVKIGSGCKFGYKMGGGYFNGTIEIQPRYKNSCIKLGNNIATNNNLFICAANYIEIGDNTLIGQNVTIMDHEAHGMHPKDRRRVGQIGKVIIGSNVWLGNNVIVLKESIIGDNTIVAAGAVVKGVFPANVIIGGVPAKVLREKKEWEIDV